MYLGNKFFFKSVILIFSVFACFQAHAEQEANTRNTTQAPAKTSSSFEIGINYLMFNETLKISQGGTNNEGFANYAGLGLTLEKNWMSGRWFRGGSLSYAVGKATSGGFETAPTFADGIDRSWWAAQANIFGLYRLNANFMAGVGLLGRHRVADWKPKDPTLTVADQEITQAAGQIILRWQVTRRISFGQTYTVLNNNGSNMWTWTAQASL
ncbi:MAG: hypothetical protein ACXVCP_09685 [Bdellovibrio sp.]